MSDYGINIGEPPPSVEDDIKYLGGVPSDYRASVPSTRSGWFDPTVHGESGEPQPYTATVTTQVPPRYAVGDEWKPLTQSWPSERIADLQAQLVDAGLLHQNKYQRGYWDDTSAAAYRKLLGYSNISGLDEYSTLQRIGDVKSKYGSTGDEGPVRRPLLIRRTDPEALNQLLDNVAVRSMGRGLSPEEKSQFVSSYQSMEEAAQRQEYELTGSGLPGGTGGEVTDVDPDAQAEKFVREKAPADVGAYQYLQAFKSFENLIARTQR